jgi:tRNA A-37 threonylcarbamoyl transferase component Bud32
MSFRTRVRRTATPRENTCAQSTEPRAHNRLSRYAHSVKNSLFLSCFKSPGSAAEITSDADDYFAPRNDSAIPVKNPDIRTTPPSQAKETIPLQLTTENLTSLNNNSPKKLEYCSESSSEITCITECLQRLGIEEIPEPALPNIPVTKPKLIKKIGTGSNATVWLAEMQKHDDIINVAVKLSHTENNVEEAKQEAEFTATIAHPNIIKTYGFDQASNGIIMELAMTDLRQISQKLSQAQDNEKADVSKALVKQIINALFHIFRKRILHNDAHASNFFYKKGGVVVLGDFGLAERIHKGYDISKYEFRLFDDSRTNLANHLSKNESLPIIELLGHANIYQNTARQREMRDKYIELWASTQKWECISNEVLDQKIHALLQMPLPARQSDD